MYVTTDRVGK